MVLWVGLGGCGVPPAPTPNAVQEIEPNDSFPGAQIVTIPSGQTLTINGFFVWGQDPDIYDLGTFEAGQTLSASLTGDSAVNPNNVQFGFFDQDQEVAILDDNAITAAEQQISLTIRKPGKYYLALSDPNQPPSSSYTYSVLITVGSAAIPTPPKQIVFLNYNGISTITIGGFTFNNVLPFSAIGSSLNPPLIASLTTSAIQADYTPYNIQILSSYDTLEPTVPHSTVYVSGGSGTQQFYGLASSVDWYNQDPTDNAIVFAGLLTNSGLSQTQFVTALANITAHEMGHLSGLAHTVDHTELMDQVTPLNSLDQPQTFHLAPLAEFPVGTENTPQLLQFALGLFQ
jgi:hypothetical protein